MDVNATLAAIRALYLAAFGLTDLAPETPFDVATARRFLTSGGASALLSEADTEELRELIDAYDGWVARGGFRPLASV